MRIGVSSAELLIIPESALKRASESESQRELHAPLVARQRSITALLDAAAFAAAGEIETVGGGEADIRWQTVGESGDAGNLPVIERRLRDTAGKHPAALRNIDHVAQVENLLLHGQA